MTRELDLATMGVPYGVLHDQRLSSVKLEDDKMIFSFCIELYKEDYTEDIYNKYKEYKHCDMTVELCDLQLNEYSFKTSVKKDGTFKGISLNRDAFIDVINNASHATLIECSMACNEFRIELSTGFYDAKRPYKKYNKYSVIEIVLYAKQVTWNWY